MNTEIFNCNNSKSNIVGFSVLPKPIKVHFSLSISGIFAIWQNLLLAKKTRNTGVRLGNIRTNTFYTSVNMNKPNLRLSSLPTYAVRMKISEESMLAEVQSEVFVLHRSLTVFPEDKPNITLLLLHTWQSDESIHYLLLCIHLDYALLLIIPCYFTKYSWSHVIIVQPKFMISV